MENKEIRKANLEALYEKRRMDTGMTKAQFAELIDTSPAAFSQLLGENPQYPMIEINGNCKIIGVVVDAKILNIP